MPVRLTLVSALVLSALCCTGAGAQIFTGMEPRQPLVIPQPVANPAPAAAVSAPKVVVPVPASATDLVRHMPNTLEGFRITGETGELQWPVYLSRNQAEGSLRFRLTYLSAVSDLDGDLLRHVEDQLAAQSAAHQSTRRRLPRAWNFPSRRACCRAATTPCRLSSSSAIASTARCPQPMNSGRRSIARKPAWCSIRRRPTGPT